MLPSNMLLTNWLKRGSRVERTHTCAKRHGVTFGYTTPRNKMVLSILPAHPVQKWDAWTWSLNALLLILDSLSLAFGLSGSAHGSSDRLSSDKFAKEKASLLFFHRSNLKQRFSPSLRKGREETSRKSEEDGSSHFPCSSSLSFQYHFWLLLFFLSEEKNVTE